MKSLVTHWRSSGILIAMYLDDGFIVVPKCGSDNSHLSTAREISAHVKVDVLRAGLVYNKKQNCVGSSNLISLARYELGHA